MPSIGEACTNALFYGCHKGGRIAVIICVAIGSSNLTEETCCRNILARICYYTLSCVECSQIVSTRKRVISIAIESTAVGRTHRDLSRSEQTVSIVDTTVCIADETAIRCSISTQQFTCEHTIVKIQLSAALVQCYETTMCTVRKSSEGAGNLRCTYAVLDMGSTIVMSSDTCTKLMACCHSTSNGQILDCSVLQITEGSAAVSCSRQVERHGLACRTEEGSLEAVSLTVTCHRADGDWQKTNNGWVRVKSSPAQPIPDTDDSAERAEYERQLTEEQNRRAEEDPTGYGYEEPPSSGEYGEITEEDLIETPKFDSDNEEKNFLKEEYGIDPEKQKADMIATAKRVLTITESEIRSLSDELIEMYPVGYGVYYEECIRLIQKYVSRLA